MVTQKWSDGDQIYLTCDHHAPGKATPIDRDPLLPENLVNTISQLRGPGVATLRSKLSGQFGIRLQSTGAAANVEQSHVILQTLDATPENPYLVIFAQHILEPFTGSGQFNLIERDARRRVFDGASEGETNVISSETMDWQPEDEGEPIKVGRYPGRIYTIVSVEDSEHITISGTIRLPSIDLTLTMDGKSESTLGTSAELVNGITNGEGWSNLEKVITDDKVYRVDFVPGDTGIGVYSIQARRLY